jgi:hypothetical protein
VGTLVVKKMAKDDWDAVKMMPVGVDRVREDMAQRLRKEFEAIAFHDDETLDAFDSIDMQMACSIKHS